MVGLGHARPSQQPAHHVQGLNGEFVASVFGFDQAAVFWGTGSCGDWLAPVVWKSPHPVRASASASASASAACSQAMRNNASVRAPSTPAARSAASSMRCRTAGLTTRYSWKSVSAA
ncbi:Hypothetical Protein XCAW_03729 [Xanthomonas citri subsp. citri Aw12879]|nr:Hypothetical Protein XCAW_03729 [Xanthomonas citri subsp. citri Aw12879]